MDIEREARETSCKANSENTKRAEKLYESMSINGGSIYSKVVFFSAVPRTLVELVDSSLLTLPRVVVP